jgi:hypothetical protein
MYILLTEPRPVILNCDNFATVTIADPLKSISNPYRVFAGDSIIFKGTYNECESLVYAMALELGARGLPAKADEEITWLDVRYFLNERGVHPAVANPLIRHARRRTEPFVKELYTALVEGDLDNPIILSAKSFGPVKLESLKRSLGAKGISDEAM